MRRMPPANVQNNIAALLDLAPELTEELLSRVDQPLQIAYDEVAQKEYLLCDYNRDGDSYRSPWSNTYFPELGDGAVPSDAIRELEAHANEVFDAYREQYFEGGVSSVYLWELENVGFAGCFLIKKGSEDSKRGELVDGFWDSIHVVEVVLSDDGKEATYKLTSTIMLSLHSKAGLNLSGSITRQKNLTAPCSEGHIVNIGTTIEDMENTLRNQLDQVYFSKTRDILSELRTAGDAVDHKKNLSLQACLIGEMMGKKKSSTIS